MKETKHLVGCRRCRLLLPEESFYPKNKDGSVLRTICKKCMYKYQIRWVKKNREKVDVYHQNYKNKHSDRLKSKDLKRRLGITLDDKNRMIEKQNSRCYVCDKKLEFSQCCVDHDHNTGKIRKILCTNCNKGLGIFKDDVKLLEKLVLYLKEHE